MSNLHFPKEIKEKLSESAYHTLKPEQAKQIVTQKEAQKEKGTQDSSEIHKTTSIVDRIAQKKAEIAQRESQKQSQEKHKSSKRDL